MRSHAQKYIEKLEKDEAKQEDEEEDKGKCFLTILRQSVNDIGVFR